MLAATAAIATVHPLAVVAGGIAAVGAVSASLAPALGSAAMVVLGMTLVGGSAAVAISEGANVAKMALLTNGATGFLLMEGALAGALKWWARCTLAEVESEAER